MYANCTRKPFVCLYLEKKIFFWKFDTFKSILWRYLEVRCLDNPAITACWSLIENIIFFCDHFVHTFLRLHWRYTSFFANQLLHNLHDMHDKTMTARNSEGFCWIIFNTLLGTYTLGICWITTTPSTSSFATWRISSHFTLFCQVQRLRSL